MDPNKTIPVFFIKCVLCFKTHIIATNCLENEESRTDNRLRCDNSCGNKLFTVTMKKLLPNQIRDELIKEDMREKDAKSKNHSQM